MGKNTPLVRIWSKSDQKWVFPILALFSGIFVKKRGQKMKILKIWPRGLSRWAKIHLRCEFRKNPLKIGKTPLKWGSGFWNWGPLFTTWFCVKNQKFQVFLAYEDHFWDFWRPFWAILSRFCQACPKIGVFLRKTKNSTFSLLRSGNGLDELPW